MISLDFELAWGMRDRGPFPDQLRTQLFQSRQLVLQVAQELSDRTVRATWATVGFLFASSRQEIESFRPKVQPRYALRRLDPYGDQLGADETDDPLHMAGSVVRHVGTLRGQEIGSHTFSHYYCLEPGQDETAFRADLASARAIAEHCGLGVSSLVLPRNQWNPAYAAAVVESGFSCYRGPQRSWGYRPAPAAGSRSLVRRGARLADTYLGPVPPPTTGWEEVEEDSGLCNVPASAFLRPYSERRRALEPLRTARLSAGLRHAARSGRIFHLWWHPHNFMTDPAKNFDLLRRVLDEFTRLAEAEGMRSLAMGDVPALVSEPSG